MMHMCGQVGVVDMGGPKDKDNLNSGHARPPAPCSLRGPLTRTATLSFHYRQTEEKQ